MEEELRSYSIDPQAERLTNEEYEAAVAELENRQAATAADSSPQMAARTAQIRNILAWHLHKVQTQSHFKCARRELVKLADWCGQDSTASLLNLHLP